MHQAIPTHGWLCQRRLAGYICGATLIVCGLGAAILRMRAVGIRISAIERELVCVQRAKLLC